MIELIKSFIARRKFFKRVLYNWDLPHYTNSVDKYNSVVEKLSQDNIFTILK